MIVGGRARLGGGARLGTTPDRPWLRSVGRQLAERHLGRLLLAVTGVGDRHLVAGLVGPDRGRERRGVGDVPVVDLADHVALLETGVGGGLALLHATDHGAGALLGIADADAEVGVGRLTVVDELVGDDPGVVDRDREPDADVAALRAGARPAGQRGDGGVDADDLAVGVDERTAGVAGVMAASVWMASMTASVAPLGSSPWSPKGESSGVSCRVIDRL